jgi:hypothetical protein
MAETVSSNFTQSSNTLSSGNGFNKIKVIVRVRPFLEEELKAEDRAINSAIRTKEATNEVE